MTDLPIPYLEPGEPFPDVDTALDEPNGLLALGADLSPERLYSAYKMGIFPWFNEGEPIQWWCPNPRAVIFLDEFTLPSSLGKALLKQPYHTEFNQHFIQVIEACQQRNPKRESGETWITDSMKQAYIRLHQQGMAQCMACFEGNNLVGGIYGVRLGKVFFGESMVSLANNASKIALVALVEQLKREGVKLLDCQQPSEHLVRFGQREISRKNFTQLLITLTN